MDENLWKAHNFPTFLYDTIYVYMYNFMCQGRQLIN